MGLELLSLPGLVVCVYHVGPWAQPVCSQGTSFESMEMLSGFISLFNVKTQFMAIKGTGNNKIKLLSGHIYDMNSKNNHEI